MDLLEATHRELLKNSELVFEALDCQGEISMSLSIRAIPECVYSTLSMPGDRQVTISTDTLLEALSYWIFNLDRESGLPMYSPQLRAIKRKIFDWI